MPIKKSIQLTSAVKVLVTGFFRYDTLSLTGVFASIIWCGSIACLGQDSTRDSSVLVGEGAIAVTPPEDDDAGSNSDGATPNIPIDDEIDVDPEPEPTPDSGFPLEPCQETATITLSPEEAVEQIIEYDNQRVMIVGTSLTVDQASCHQECDTSEPCCLSCQSSLLLGEILLKTSACTNVASVGCTQSDCGPEVCTPPLLETPATYEGILRSGSPVVLELIQVRN